MTVREANKNDCEIMDGLLTELIRYETRYDSNLSHGYTVKNNYAERLEWHGHKAFIAEENGEAAGFIYGFVYIIPGMYVSPVAIVDAFYVREEFRGRGIGRELFSEFKKFAAAENAARIELKVMSENDKALALYGSLGFRETKKYMALELDR